MPRLRARERHRRARADGVAKNRARVRLHAARNVRRDDRRGTGIEHGDRHRRRALHRGVQPDAEDRVADDGSAHHRGGLARVHRVIVRDRAAVFHEPPRHLAAVGRHLLVLADEKDLHAPAALFQNMRRGKAVAAVVPRTAQNGGGLFRPGGKGGALVPDGALPRRRRRKRLCRLPGGALHLVGKRLRRIFHQGQRVHPGGDRRGVRLAHARAVAQSHSFLFSFCPKNSEIL